MHDFGVYAAVGVGWPTSAFTLLPSVWCLPHLPPSPNKGQRLLERHPASGLALDLRNKRTLAYAWMAVAVGSAWLGSSLQLDNKLIEDLREDDPFRQQFAFFEREFAGVRPLSSPSHFLRRPRRWPLQTLDAGTVPEGRLWRGSHRGASHGGALAHRGWMGDRESAFSIPADRTTLRRIMKPMKRSGQWRMLVADDAAPCASLERWKTVARKPFRPKTTP